MILKLIECLQLVKIKSESQLASYKVGNIFPPNLSPSLYPASCMAFLCSEESGIMTGSIVDFDQSISGWHSYSVYDHEVLKDTILGE